jgi:DNA-binding beta-propeller fold protein YncE
MLMLGRRLVLLVGFLLCVVGGGLVLGGASAFALNEHLFSGSFGGEGAGNGQFVEPSGVAVDASTHGVYVVDRGNNRVEVFSSAGAYVSQFDGSAAPTGVFSSPSAIAVDNSGNVLDPSAGDVYVVDTGHNVIDKFSSTGTYLGQLTGTTGGASFGELDGVAVDAAGVVWVYQGSGEIDSFSDALGNEYLSKRSSPFEVSPGFAVDSEDDLYVNRGARVFAKLNSSGEALIEEVDGEASTAAAVDFSSGEVFIDEVHTVGAFSSTGSFLERFGAEQGVEHLQGGSGVAVDPGSGTVYVADATADVVDVFTVVVVPDVATGSASGVQPTSASVSGVVNPDGIPLSECRFEYGASTAYGQSVPCVPAAGSIPADSNEHAVSADLTGLVPGSTYHFRLRAANASGANFGADATFETPPPPSIDSTATVNLTASSTDLTARINPQGLDTTYRFEYGASAAYGGSVPVPDGHIVAGVAAQTVTQHVAGLQAGTTYHWRVIAQSAAGVTTGVDHTFVYDTGGGGLPDNRAYEMVTPPQKNGALIGDVFLGRALDLSEDGSRVFITTIACFAGTGACNANRGLQGTPVAFTRASGGWVASGLTPSASRFDAATLLGYSATAGTALFSVPTSSGGGDVMLARGPDGGC